MNRIKKSISVCAATTAVAGWLLLAILHPTLVSADESALRPRSLYPSKSMRLPDSHIPVRKPNARYAKSLDTAPLLLKPQEHNATLGVRSTFHDLHGKRGEHIDKVQIGSLADKLNLQVGDVILSVNGTDLTRPESWRRSVNRVERLGGWLTLKIRRLQNGTIVYRTANLNSSDQ